MSCRVTSRRSEALPPRPPRGSRAPTSVCDVVSPYLTPSVPSVTSIRCHPSSEGRAADVRPSVRPSQFLRVPQGPPPGGTRPRSGTETKRAGDGPMALAPSLAVSAFASRSFPSLPLREKKTAAVDPVFPVVLPKRATGSIAAVRSPPECPAIADRRYAESPFIEFIPAAPLSRRRRGRRYTLQ